MLVGESGGALTVPRHDQRRDLDDLAIAPRGDAGVPLRGGEVPLRGGGIAGIRRHDGPQGMLDRAHRGDVAETRLALVVMPPQCDQGLTRG